MIYHPELQREELLKRIKHGQIRFAGNKSLKIYGLLSCTSGKRMKKENRVFFHNEAEAIQEGFRPCGHCLKEQYRLWKIEQETG